MRTLEIGGGRGLLEVISIWDASGQCTSWVNSRQIEVVSSCSLWSLGDTVVFRVTYKLARNSGH